MKKKTNISDEITQIQQLITEFKQLKQNKTFDDIYICWVFWSMQKSWDIHNSQQGFDYWRQKKLPMWKLFFSSDRESIKMKNLLGISRAGVGTTGPAGRMQPVKIFWIIIYKLYILVFLKNFSLQYYQFTRILIYLE